MRRLGQLGARFAALGGVLVRARHACCMEEVPPPPNPMLQSQITRFFVPPPPPPRRGRPPGPVARPGPRPADLVGELPAQETAGPDGALPSPAGEALEPMM